MDIDRVGAVQTVDHINASGGKALALAVDVADEDQVRGMVEQTVARFGRLDVAFNNAGIVGTPAPTADGSADNFDRVIAVNLRGTYVCMHYEIRQMLAQGGGAIVNAGSITSLGGFAGIPAYVASKHGIIGLTKTAALEYATANIRINAVCPGTIDTPMTDGFTGGSDEVRAGLAAMQPVGRMGTADEAAAAVLWLASDAASFVTGALLSVDGGYKAR